MLLERLDVNPNTADEDGEIALLWAANKRHKGVLKLLLEWDDVNHNFPKKVIQYWHYSRQRRGRHMKRGLVKLLLERFNVDSNTTNVDKDSKTPLFRATHGRQEGVVNMLLKWDDINPDA